MKKVLKIAGFILLCIAVVAFAAVCITSEHFGSASLSEISIEELECYLNEKVIPIVVLVLTAIGTILMALLPLIGKIKRSSESFKAAEEGIRSTSADTRRLQSETVSMFEEMKSQIDELRKLCCDTDAKIGEINERERHIESVMRLGFCNTPSLVRNGYARKIYEMTETTENKNEKA